MIKMNSHPFVIRGRGMTSEITTTQIEDDDPNLVPIDGPDGRFWVAFTGSCREAPLGFFYRDNRARFGFYADMDPIVKAWNVTRTSTGVWTGPYFKKTADSEAIFRRNIAFFFATRRATDPARMGDGSAGPTIFSWKIF